MRRKREGSRAKESEEAIVPMMERTTKAHRREGPLLLLSDLIKEALRDCES
jgi:hypothetical protein